MTTLERATKRSTNPKGTTGATDLAGNVTARRRDGTMIELDAATIEAFAACFAGDLLRRRRRRLRRGPPSVERDDRPATRR